MQLCEISQPGRVEVFALQGDRYAYELRQNGSVSVQLVYADNALYVKTATPPVPGCDWFHLTREELGSIQQLDNILLLPPEALRSRVPGEKCQGAALLESVFEKPKASCPIRQVLAASVASQGQQAG